jgi:hypothetical protein
VRLADELSRIISDAGRDIENLLGERFDEDDVVGEDVCVIASRSERDVADVAQRINAAVSLAIDNARDIGPRAQDQIMKYQRGVRPCH